MWRSVGSADSPEVTIRPATVDDADSIAQVVVASWRAAYAGLLPADFLAGLDVATRAEQWRNALASAAAASTVLVAEVGDRIVGFVAVGPELDAEMELEAEGEQGVGQLYALYVDPPHWDTGVGHALHDAGLAAVRDAGFGIVRLWVLRGNDRAIRFYVRHGWSLDGRQQVDRYFGGIELPEVGLTRYVTSQSDR